MWVSAFSTKLTRRPPPPDTVLVKSHLGIDGRYGGCCWETLGWELTSENKYSCGLCVQFQMWLRCDKAGYTKRNCTEMSTAQWKRPEVTGNEPRIQTARHTRTTSWSSLVVLKFSLIWMGYILLNGPHNWLFNRRKKKIVLNHKKLNHWKKKNLRNYICNLRS